MAQIIQLQFDFTPNPAPQQEDGEQKTDVPNGRKATKRAGKNPCTKCYLREVCDNDYCGRNLFPIDVNEIY